MLASERTPLKTSVRALKYDPIQYTDLESELKNGQKSSSTTVHLNIESSSSSSGQDSTWKTKHNVIRIAAVTCFGLAMLLTIAILTSHRRLPIEGAAWTAIAQPYTIANPMDLGFVGINRFGIHQPGGIFDAILRKDPTVPLPTNSWSENLFLGDTRGPTNKVFQLPYIIDTDTHEGSRQGLDTHPAHVQANDRMVMMTYESRNGMMLGANEQFLEQHQVSDDLSLALGRLSVVLEWKSEEYNNTGKGPFMSAPIVRGAPYMSMIYRDATPKITVQRPIVFNPVIDNEDGNTLICGQGEGVFSSEPKLVTKELKVHFDISDFTWLIFVSEPTEFKCSTVAEPEGGDALPPGVVAKVHGPTGHFELIATKPMALGMVRIALANNCTTGQNAEYCGPLRKPRDQSEFTTLLREHSDVYPTGSADIGFTFPTESQEEEELRLNFLWEPALMSNIASDWAKKIAGDTDDVVKADPTLVKDIPPVELLTYAIPHHQERMMPFPGSSNVVHSAGCVPTIHGTACPVSGGHWSLLEHLHRVSFHAPRVPKEEMLPDIRAALKTDIHYALPDNYMRGAGDTYFSGKMLARLARVLIVAKEVGGVPQNDFNDALGRLKSGIAIWLNGSAESPMLYDKSWGGVVMCGCDFDGDTQGCRNRFPDCPALVDQGQNFGAGFYNDHHFHFGYHIYAAAVAAKFDTIWGKQFYEHVMLLVRDIANPSPYDPFFPTFRHKDWFLGFSWASGVVTIEGKPYPNGRNEESSSESIFAYEAIALYGEVMSTAFEGESDPEGVANFEATLRLRDMGRLLLATEVRSAKTYWHVQSPETSGVSRIYPNIYSAKVVGMIWSMLAQEQTWFGNEAWKSFGIQMIPLTGASELRDNPEWVEEMLPQFEQACIIDKNCGPQGWSILVFAAQAEIGHWREAWKNMQDLPQSVFEEAGGNGHSRTNSLWYIATRPDYSPTQYTYTPYPASSTWPAKDAPAPISSPPSGNDADTDSSTTRSAPASPEPPVVATPVDSDNADPVPTNSPLYWPGQPGGTNFPTWYPEGPTATAKEGNQGTGSEGVDNGDSSVAATADEGPLLETAGTNDPLITTSGSVSQGYAIDVYGMQGPYAGTSLNVNPSTSSSTSSSSAPTAATTHHAKRHTHEPAPEPTIMPSLPAWTRSPSPTVKPTSWWWGPWH